MKPHEELQELRCAIDGKLLGADDSNLMSSVSLKHHTLHMDVFQLLVMQTLIWTYSDLVFHEFIVAQRRTRQLLWRDAVVVAAWIWEAPVLSPYGHVFEEDTFGPQQNGFLHIVTDVARSDGR